MQQCLVQMKRLLLAKVDIIHLKTFKARFLNFGTLDILNQITICCSSVGAKGVLYIAGCLPAPLDSTHWMPVALTLQL